jgi:hypothetical protein
VINIALRTSGRIICFIAGLGLRVYRINVNCRKQVRFHAI